MTRMKRLAPLLAGPAGEAAFVAAFKTDLDKRVVVELQVSAVVPLVCQASLEVYDQQLERSSVLGVIEDIVEQENLPDHYDPVQTERGRLAIASLVEDELLLGLPQIPRKPGLEPIKYSTGGPFQEEGQTPAGDRKSPFADLHDMIKRDKQQ
ncbi:MAG: YceD family protein [Xanthomonadales bacterium]|nr:YceD family protein [Xanthomonadales bacterium]